MNSLTNVKDGHSFIILLGIQLTILLSMSYAFAMDAMTGRWQAFICLPLSLILMAVAFPSLIIVLRQFKQLHWNNWIALVLLAFSAINVIPFSSIYVAKAIASKMVFFITG